MIKPLFFGMMISLLCNNAIASGGGGYAKATLYNASRRAVGQVEFSQQRKYVKVEVSVNSLTPGFHGFHIHTTGKCEVAPQSVFLTAGGHFHLGVSNNHQSHSGDFPVLLVNKDGVAKAEFITDRFQVKDLFDADGSAVIVHEKPDNYANIPSPPYPAANAATLATGDAGPRQLCGVVKAKH